MTMPVLAIQQNNGAALQEFFRAVLLDSENKVPSEALRIVGALSDGHIIESGDNANGNYVRFADGTQVCWIPSIQSTESSGATRSIDWTCPAQFIGDISCVATTLSSVNGRAFFAYGYGLDDNNTVHITFSSNIGSSISGVLTACCIVVGRWKE